MAEMTREQRDKAVAIAKDILAQIRAGDSYRMTRGTYMEPDIDLGVMEGDVQDHFAAITPKCHVCMVGAAVLSKAKLYDGVPMDAIRGENWEMKAALYDVFDDETIDAMEAAFENTAGLSSLGFTPFLISAAVFGSQYDTAIERAEAVAENIIEHDGLFVVPIVGRAEYDARDTNYDWQNEDDDFCDEDEDDDIYDEEDDEDEPENMT